MLLLIPAVIVVKHSLGSYLVRALELGSDSLTTLATNTSTCPKKRTQYEIVWNCLTTIIICTWVSIHPNIPPQHKGHLGVFWRRIKLMLWSLIVPELILGWAFRQWLAAREIEKEYKGAIHIFFVRYQILIKPRPWLDEVAWSLPHHGRIQPRQSVQQLGESNDRNSKNTSFPPRPTKRGGEETLSNSHGESSG